MWAIWTRKCENGWWRGGLEERNCSEQEVVCFALRVVSALPFLCFIYLQMLMIISSLGYINFFQYHVSGFPRPLLSSSRSKWSFSSGVMVLMMAFKKNQKKLLAFIVWKWEDDFGVETIQCRESATSIFVRFCKQCKKHTIYKHIFDPATCFMIQHGIPIELIFSVKIQLKTPSGNLGGIKTHYKLDEPKIIHLSHW